MPPIAALLLAASATPGFTVAGDPARGLTYTAKQVPADQLPALEAAVAADARRRCGTGRITFGPFRYVQAVARGGVPSPVVYRRQISCRAPSELSPYPVAADWAATPNDDAAAREAAARLFAAYDRGDAAAVLGMQGQAATADEVARRVIDWRRAAGAGRRIVDRVTWYVNPAGAPIPGLYVALDWHGGYAGLAVACGYVVLYRTAQGYLVTREETNMLRRADATTPEGRARARAAAVRLR